MFWDIYSDALAGGFKITLFIVIAGIVCFFILPSLSPFNKKDNRLIKFKSEVDSDELLLKKIEYGDDTTYFYIKK